MTDGRALRVRWLGRVPYGEALTLQRALHAQTADDYLLLLEHPHVYTLGRRSHAEHVLVDPATVGATLEEADRGGDVTYHGPGQLVGYPIVTLPEWRNGDSGETPNGDSGETAGRLTDMVAYVRRLESVLVAALADLGVEAGVERGLTGVWSGGAKVAAIGVKVTRGRTMHGFALNVDPDLGMFSHIVPCGIRDRDVTSLRRLLGRPVAMRTVVDAVVARCAEEFGAREVERQDVVWQERTSDLAPFSRGAALISATRSAEMNAGAIAGARRPTTGKGDPVRLLGRLAEAGVSVPAPEAGNAFRRPEWMKVKARLGSEYRDLKRMMRDLDLHTVCEEAGCPNIYECWADRTATFMILGDRCTRACGFCLVDTRKPLPLDGEEPRRVAAAVERMGLAHVVITSVARDDLADGGASGFSATIRAVRARVPGAKVEVLIPDCKGDAAALDEIFTARPDVLNHNLETVARLQRAARPSAGYARSLSLLARAKDAGLLTKSGLILGLGETVAEVRGAVADLRSVGVDILTMGQYLRPSEAHLPVARWWHPDEFTAVGDYARSLGFAHVESAPLVRSSYHARRAADGSSSGTLAAG